MNLTNQESFVVDPWQGKTVILSVITFALLFAFLIFAVYDGIAFYARFQQICTQNPDKAECKNFNNPANVSTKPKLNLVLNGNKGKYAIQVGAYKKEEYAQNTVAQLQSYGVQARIIKVNDSKRNTWHQVQLGRFESQKLASQAARQLEVKGIIKDFTVAGYSSTK